jgi:tight adherence protein B
MDIARGAPPAALAARLTALAMRPAHAIDAPTISLRRPLPQRKGWPSTIAARLELAFASAGDRVGLLHLFLAGISAAAITALTSLAADFRAVFAIPFGIAAAIGAPTALLRVTRSRYQRQFLDAFPDALDLIIRAVRAGLPAADAIEAATREWYRERFWGSSFSVSVFRTKHSHRAALP